MKKPSQFFLGMVLGCGCLTGSFSKVTIAQTSPPPENRPAITTEADQKFILTLVKTALVAVNQGNLTGNYTVLRDLGSSQFRQKNTSADLGEIFKNFRQAQLDFGAVVEYSPIFSQPPTISPQNTVRTAGYFPTQPIIEFDILFQWENKRYAIDSISLGIKKTP